MKLEYLDNIRDGEKFPLAVPDRLLRLYDFDSFELSKIRHLIKRTLIDREGQLIISNLDFVLPVNCKLTFELSEHDSGIKLQETDERHFLGQFSRNTYINMLEIIDLPGDGFNWLYDPGGDGQIHLLLSKGGGW